MVMGFIHLWKHNNINNEKIKVLHSNIEHWGFHVADLPVDGFGVDVCDHDVSEPSEYLSLLWLHQHRRIDSCRAATVRWQVSVSVSSRLSSSSELCYVPWILMSAMLRWSSHTSTWKQPNTANSLKLNTPPSLAALDAAQRAETSQTTFAQEILTHPWAGSLHSPVRPCPGFSTCFLASRLRAALSCGGMVLFR